jgi:hypothetical protein
MSVATRKWLPQRIAKTPSWRSVAECGDTRKHAPADDPMPSPHRTTVGLHRIEKSGGLSMENDKEGSASPTVAAIELEVAARGKITMLAPEDSSGSTQLLVAVPRGEVALR